MLRSVLASIARSDQEMHSFSPNKNWSNRFSNSSLGGSPGLVVMGDDPCSRGDGSNPGVTYYLDGHDIFTLIYCKIVMMFV